MANREEEELIEGARILFEADTDRTDSDSEASENERNNNNSIRHQVTVFIPNYSQSQQDAGAIRLSSYHDWSSSFRQLRRWQRQLEELTQRMNYF